MRIPLEISNPFESTKDSAFAPPKLKIQFPTPQCSRTQVARIASRLSTRLVQTNSSCAESVLWLNRYLQVREPQEEVNRLWSIWGNEQDWFFSEMLQSQDPEEFQTWAAAEEQVDPEPCQVIRPGSAEEKVESESLYVPAAMVILFSPFQVSISYDSLILWTWFSFQRLFFFFSLFSF